MSKTIYIIVLIFAITSLLIVCGKKKPTEPTHETNPPTLLYTSPANTASNIGVDAVISATFSEPIDSTTVNAITFSVNNSVTGDYSFNGNTIYLTPFASFSYSTTYTCQLTTGLTDSVGNNLTAIITWSFITEPDPAITAPTVVEVSPANNAINVYGDVVLTATFSKEMDESTLNNTSFSLNNSATGVVTYSNKIATLTPDDTLIYDTVYTATISTAVADTFGNNLGAAYSWNFRTISDPFIPLLSFSHPFDSAIVDDTVTIIAAVSHPVGVDSVEFYIDDAIVSSATDLTAPYEYLLDASSWEIGSLHDISTKAYYGPSHVGYSDTIEIIYLWEEMATDDSPEGLPQDVVRMLARSTETVLELRYEYAKNWSYPYPLTMGQFNDSTIDLGIYLDTDLNPSTGRSDFAGQSLNGIGADHRIIIGLHGGDSAVAFWNSIADPEFWDLTFDTTGLDYHNVPMDTNIFEFGINWDDMNSSYGAYIVGVHVHFTDTTLSSIQTDWIPNQNAGFVTVAKDGRYIGAPFSAGKIKPSTKPRSDSPIIKFENNPFK
ncbi:MAG: Ig-like domain-containing protein [candidate division Zixibacteria bacterium]|nr:Ig-like domain-containing protein [candidate division Zixibacteria bacterium]